MINVFAPDFEVVNGFRSGARELLGDSRGFTTIKQNSLALIKFSGRDKLLPVFRPEWMIVRATNGIIMSLDVQVDTICCLMNEFS